MSFNVVSSVADYYDRWQVGYRWLWSPKNIHYGHWTANTRDHAQSLENANVLVAKWCELGPSDRALDAGCGVAGPALHISRITGAQIEGVTVSEKQLNDARDNIRSAGSRCVRVHLQDYCNTAFADESFDAVYGLESICYAEHKRAFVTEAQRVLKPGGRIAVMDGFLASEHRTDEDQQWIERFLPGWKVPNLVSLTHFQQCLREEGFVDVKFVDCSLDVQRSARRIAMLGYSTLWPAAALERLGIPLASEIRSQADACIAQYWISRLGIAKYGAFVARKPSSRTEERNA